MLVSRELKPKVKQSHSRSSEDTYINTCICILWFCVVPVGFFHGLVCLSEELSRETCDIQVHENFLCLTFSLRMHRYHFFKG